VAQVAQCQDEKIRIGGILCWRNLVRLSLHDAPDRPGLAAEVFAALGRSGINVPFIVQITDCDCQAQIVFSVSASDAPAAFGILRSLQAQLGASDLAHEPEVAIVAIYGPDFRERAGIAGAMFASLRGVGINILAISTSISTVSCLLRQEDACDAVAVLEQSFILP